ncbi:MAG TPA: cysteine--tRNA ligase [Spirochaetia bacterium]|nr:MAG: cysteine--tRNA ligase [Spirochaetes bacterium GWB1_36_13]HCL56681.1 cysteine--tRNA ligase [Spirochaetia bacterium]
MGLSFYNTLSKSKESFQSIEEGKIKVYTCGPTVYNYVHIGNLRTFLFEDLLIRYLKYLSYQVTHVMNLTDVDDKTIRGAKEKGQALKEYTLFYSEAFFRDLKTLNALPADFYPAATNHIKEMVDLIKILLNKAIAYQTEDGSIYFSIRKFKDYGALSGMKPDNLLDGASGRVSNDEYSKEEMKDFVLWKAYDLEDGDVFWETELGKGRPGWHIECSAMSMKYLGESFDIHCGGIDNAFPHHENEIAQSEAATGKKFVHYWLHSAFLNVNSEKMAKSKKNFYTLKDLLEKDFAPMSIRYSLITTHYRQPLNFSEELIAQSDAALKRVKEFVSSLKYIKTEKRFNGFEKIIQEAREGFVSHMNDDLNISPAMASVFDFIRKVNGLKDELGEKDARQALDFIGEINQVVGVFQFEDEILEEEILNLIEERNQARREKNFKKSDEIRELLLAKGILLKDTKEGTQWQKTS